uniref:Uncharacterized protein n=1 Tax=Strongyloides venezuelensis TaxID=75913 RepID=A0A0K0FHY7_STRVS
MTVKTETTSINSTMRFEAGSKIVKDSILNSCNKMNVAFTVDTSSNNEVTKAVETNPQDNGTEVPSSTKVKSKKILLIEN